MAKVELKQPIVAEISELLNGAASAVVVDYGYRLIPVCRHGIPYRVRFFPSRTTG